MTHTLLNAGMPATRCSQAATDVKSRPDALNVIVPVGPAVAAAAAGAVVGTAPAAVVVDAPLPDKPAAVCAAAEGAAVAALFESPPWKPVSQTSLGMVRAIPCSRPPHETSFCRTWFTWVLIASTWSWSDCTVPSGAHLGLQSLVRLLHRSGLVTRLRHVVRLATRQQRQHGQQRDAARGDPRQDATVDRDAAFERGEVDAPGRADPAEREPDRHRQVRIEGRQLLGRKADVADDDASRAGASSRRNAEQPGHTLVQPREPRGAAGQQHASQRAAPGCVR